jgi:hypothetical protein
MELVSGQIWGLVACHPRLQTFVFAWPTISPSATNMAHIGPVSATASLTSQVNAAQSGSPPTSTSSIGLDWLDDLFSFRPWALECVAPMWSDTWLTAWVLSAPWIVAVIIGFILLFCVRKSADDRTRDSVISLGAVLMDLLYVPASLHAIKWLNRDTTLESRADLYAPKVSAQTTRLF